MARTTVRISVKGKLNYEAIDYMIKVLAGIESNKSSSVTRRYKKWLRENGYLVDGKFSNQYFRDEYFTIDIDLYLRYLEVYNDIRATMYHCYVSSRLKKRLAFFESIPVSAKKLDVSERKLKRVRAVIKDYGDLVFYDDGRKNGVKIVMTKGMYKSINVVDDVVDDSDLLLSLIS